MKSNNRGLNKMLFEMMCVFPKIGIAQNGCFIMENPIKMG